MMNSMFHYRTGYMPSLVACAGALLCASALGAQAPQATVGAHYIERELRVHIAGSEPNGLDVLEVYFSAPGKHPLALLTHGTATSPQDRAQLTPWLQFWQALWFAQRGYVALVVIRRGYGNSSGKQDGAFSPCSGRGTFQEAGEASADDLSAVVAYAGRSLPEVDTSSVISAGVSTGGFAQVALAADPPAGLKAAISFAGGRGGDGKGDLCDEPGLISAFGSFGKHARVPMLWIYAANDKWFVPTEASKFYATFSHNGGVAEFVAAPPDGEDGHGLYSHIAAWSDTVDGFLRKQNLLPLAAPYPEPTPPKVDPPAGLSARSIEGFNRYLLSGPYKAFAVDGAGTWGDSMGQMSQQLADARAVDNCNKHKHAGHSCTVVARTK